MIIPYASDEELEKTIDEKELNIYVEKVNKYSENLEISEDQVNLNNLFAFDVTIKN